MCVKLFKITKLVIEFLAFVFLFLCCNDKKLPNQHLSKISVIRQTENHQANQPSHANLTHNQSQTIEASKKISPKYHIIVSSFEISEKSRAERLVEQLKAKNYPATLIFSSQRYRVSIESFDTETEANMARDEYRKITDRPDIWVHKTDSYKNTE